MGFCQRKRDTMKKASRLTTTFYRNFMLLIVVPLLLIIAVTLWVLRNLMLGSAFETIDVAQRTVSGGITSEIKGTSLQLSHFLLINNREALEVASAIAGSSGQERYQQTARLKELYNFVVTPSSDIIAIHFYTNDGQVISLKDDLSLPLEELKQYDFYQRALQKPNHASFGLINSTFTFQNLLKEPSRKALAISFAPDSRNSPIEMVCWYTHTSASRDITRYAKDKNLGEMYLIDSQGNLLVSPKVPQLQYQLPPHAAQFAPGRHQVHSGGKQLNVIVTPVSGTDWRLVSLVESRVLLEQFNRVTFIVLLASCIIFFLFYLFSAIFLRNIIAPVNTLAQGMARVEQGDLQTRLAPGGQEEIQALMESFNSMIDRTQQLMLANEAQQKEKMAAEMRALQSQINPHFLVNSLNSIRFTAMVSKFDNIRQMAEALIKILTASFKDPGTVYTIQDEMDMLESYIYLMKIRYSENFDVQWEVAEDCRNCGIPRLLIQPLVENAITHGFEDREEPGTITISIWRSGENLHIAVGDDGQGMDAETVECLLRGQPPAPKGGHGIGVANVHRRVQLNYGAEYGLTIESRPGQGSCFTLVFPARPLQEESNA